ncbi:MAG: hypothetical protein KC420_21625, partial [Myxococcales bacterium]|nr:hypothetical protein [Myxococcales bacterium]
SGNPYCGLHILSAPLDAEADDGAVFDNESARFVGWWSAPDDPEKHVLEASINLQRGSVRPLDAWSAWPEAVEIPSFAAAAMTITRYPARAFDGIEIEALSPAELAYEALAGLVQGARVEVALP